jgi:uncharacterized membrane protein (DUF2068 family)
MTSGGRRERPGSVENAALLPGMAAIALWMIVTALFGAFGVISHRFPAGAQATGVLAIAVLLVAAALGLMQMRRWGWALSLASALLSMCFYFWSMAHFRQFPFIVMGTVNLIFFLYLVRPEVRERLR